MSSAEFPTPEGLSNRQLDIMTACANAVAKSEDSLRFQLKLREKVKHIQNFKFLFDGHPYADHYNKLVRSYQQYLKDYFESAARQQQHAAQQHQQEIQLRKQAVAAQKRINDHTNKQQSHHQEQPFSSIEYNMGNIEVGHGQYHPQGPSEGVSRTNTNRLMEQYNAAYGTEGSVSTIQSISQQERYIREHPNYYNNNVSHAYPLGNTSGYQQTGDTYHGPVYSSFHGAQPSTNVRVGMADTGLLPTPCGNVNSPTGGVTPQAVNSVVPGFKRLRRSNTPSDSGED